MHDESLYQLASTKIHQIESELKRLNRWSTSPLTPEKLENMGAFGENTMTFEQWIQFILIPRVNQIIQEKDAFPEGSMLAAHAVRVFDGDPEAGPLHELLYEFDSLFYVEDEARFKNDTVQSYERGSKGGTVSIGDETIPEVLYTLIAVLPQFEGEALESQLQTYDEFLSFLSPTVRPEIAKLLKKTSAHCQNPESKLRIEQAAMSVANGGRAAEPY
jgi:uncharacterized protein YqcC (DUF446 family)